MLRPLAYPPSTDLPLLAQREMSRGTVPYVGLGLALVGGFLLWRSARPSNPSRHEERRGGVVFLVLGCLISIAGLANLWLD
ncbi:hypothetical protein NLX85_02575 [Micromonospora sp. A3M-1-15]|uniref:hypothetical protein n=1 Tax=Micromonospora sp. A3M-1-15 TaxID=2962035 RepID=UPI0020B85A16|nr:hypothetical protein [Micromonospora sp. A3M-1-15]MCP3782255.1 hypothetical protein [Micromonospora sp. A3M-1-15]